MFTEYFYLLNVIAEFRRTKFRLPLHFCYKFCCGYPSPANDKLKIKSRPDIGLPKCKFILEVLGIYQNLIQFILSSCSIGDVNLTNLTRIGRFEFTFIKKSENTLIALYYFNNFYNKFTQSRFICSTSFISITLLTAINKPLVVLVRITKYYPAVQSILCQFPNK